MEGLWVNRLMFGDQPSAGVMTIAIEGTYKFFQQVQKLGLYDSEMVEADALKLVQDSYVDDFRLVDLNIM